MDLSFFGPPGRRLSGEELFDLPANWMTTACMASGFKRDTGWLGLALCPSDPRFLTCRLETRDGVYGLAPVKAKDQDHTSAARLALYFFPDPDSQLLDGFSLAAQLAAAGDDYQKWVRDFAKDPHKAAPFAVADLYLIVDNDSREMVLGLEAAERRRLLSLDGVRAPGGGGWIIEPGGLDEDLPCLDLATDCMRALSLGLATCLDAKPQLAMAATDADMTLYHADGKQDIAPCTGIKHHTHVLCFGDTQKALPWFPGLARKPVDDQAAISSWTGRYQRINPVETGRADQKNLPKLVILSGFLGSGKTSFLNQFIEFHTNRGQFVTVIQNEIGETGVDGKLLEGEDSVVELDEGCVCCTLSGGLSQGVRRLVDRFKPEIIVLESTGLANPFNLVKELEELSHMVSLEAVVTLVDASHFRPTIETGEVALEQIKAADVILLNKCDMVAEAELADIQSALAGVNGRAKVLETTYGRINPGLLASVADRGQGLFEGQSCEHDHTSHHGDGFGHVRLPLPPVVKLDQLRRFLNQTPQNIYRIKGIVDTGGQDGLTALQYVQGDYEFVPLEKNYDGEPFLVCIGRGLDADALRERLSRSCLEQ